MISELDLVKLEQLAASDGWELLVRWLDQAIESELADMIRLDDPYKVAKRAGAIAAFRTVRNWPMAAIQSLKSHE